MCQTLAIITFMCDITGCIHFGKVRRGSLSYKYIKGLAHGLNANFSVPSLPRCTVLFLHLLLCGISLFVGSVGESDVVCFGISLSSYCVSISRRFP